jgi:hypothetical protein
VADDFRSRRIGGGWVALAHVGVARVMKR